MIHRFAVAQGIGDEAADAIAESFRSDAEQRHTPVALHDPESADIKLVRRLAEEVINVSGAEVKIYVRTDNNDYDAVWDEDPDPTYWNPLLMKGFFKPKPIEMEMKRWGIDTTNKTDITFSHTQIYGALGERMLRVGDVIQIPFSSITIKPKNYRVVNATPSGNFRYVWLYYTCQIELLTADVSVRPEQDVDNDNYDRGVYRESL